VSASALAPSPSSIAVNCMKCDGRCTCHATHTHTQHAQSVSTHAWAIDGAIPGRNDSWAWRGVGGKGTNQITTNLVIEVPGVGHLQAVVHARAVLDAHEVVVPHACCVALDQEAVRQLHPRGPSARGRGGGMPTDGTRFVCAVCVCVCVCD
jgi:hypothetical protein